MGRVVTRVDVAQHAGVSTAVVSYVLNGGPRPVASDTRRRVEAAIDELGYRPNAIARALRSRRSRALGLVVSDISNPFMGELARSIEVAAFEHGLSVLLGNTMVDEERQRRHLRHLVDRQVDGLLVVPVAPIDAGTIAELNDGRVPVVVLDRPVPPTPGSRHLRATTILADNAAGGEMAAAHLIGHGHRRVACLAGPPRMPPSTERLRGFERAVAAAGLDPAGCPVVRSSVNRGDGYRAARSLLRSGRPPTAVFAISDEQAIGVLRAAFESGLRVPDDLAVAGFDGIGEGAYCTPGLTTVRQPILDMAHRAVALLVRQIPSPPRRGSTETMPVALVARGSCGCPEVPANAGAQPGAVTVGGRRTP
ncbi:MAG TPA: LacI family DNA-binding transcriptional regulator [Acidimicrobiales bacterium]|nr:LacI family DNA-binding transcriptional regulator [Acidimicrobiales bacterium]